MENEKIPSVYEHGSCSRSAEPEPRPNDSRILGRKYHLYWALGFGSSAIVKLASDVTTGHGVAIKIFDKEFIDGKKKSVKKRMKIAVTSQFSLLSFHFYTYKTFIFIFNILFRTYLSILRDVFMLQASNVRLINV